MSVSKKEKIEKISILEKNNLNFVIIYIIIIIILKKFLLV